MKHLLSLFLALALAFALAVPAGAAKIELSVTGGTVVLDDAVRVGTVTIDGNRVSCYATTTKAYIRRIGLSPNTVFSVYRCTVETDGTGKLGSLLHRIDNDYFTENGFDDFGDQSWIYYYYAYDNLLDSDIYLYFETKEARGGVTRFVTRSVPSTAGLSAKPTASAPKPAQPAAVAYQRSQAVELNGRKITLPSYALKDANGYETNYVKLRDLAYLLSGTSAHFSVGWDEPSNTVNIQTRSAYVSTGSELKTPFSGDRAYTDNTAAIRINGKAADLQGIVLTDDKGGGYTYFKLRDLGKALGFNVGWDEVRGIYIESSKPYVG